MRFGLTVIMNFRSSVYTLIDFPFRLRNIIRRYLRKMELFSNSTILSDSQVTFYEQSVDLITSSTDKFKQFRRLYDYREILEHVDFNLGKNYLSRITDIDPTILSYLKDFKQNDLVGKPRRLNFQGVGVISPTTIRYISVAAEIKNLFGSLGQSSIVEIGGGYGGQCLILNKIGYFKQYTIFDLPKVQELISSYLEIHHINNVNYPREIEVPNSKYDLVISNYAYSELSRHTQLDYLEKILMNSRNGYMIMNSGDGNKSGRSTGKLSLQEILDRIPNARVLPEIPKTGPDNYVLVWTES